MTVAKKKGRRLEGMVQLGDVRVPVDLKQGLKDVAAAEDRRLVDVVRMALRQFLTARERKGAA